MGDIERKAPCIYPLEDGSRCCECSTCHGYGWPVETQRDDAIEALYFVRQQLRGAVDLLRELREWADVDDDALDDHSRAEKDAVLARVDAAIGGGSV